MNSCSVTIAAASSRAHASTNSAILAELCASSHPRSGEMSSAVARAAETLARRFSKRARVRRLSTPLLRANREVRPPMVQRVMGR